MLHFIIRIQSEKLTELASVFSSIVVRVTEQQALEVVGEGVIRDGDEVRSMSDIKQTIEIVLATDLTNRLELVVIDPNIG